MCRSNVFNLVAAAVLAAVTSASAGEGTVGVTDTEIRIGALGVLTGPLYHNGATIYDGVEAVYNEVNAAGGIYGRKIVYVREDDGCKPDLAVPAVKKLIYEDDVFMIHGGGCSNASLAALPEIEKTGIPWVITASTAPQLTDPVKPNVFTTMLAGWMETEGQLQRVLDLGAKRIAIIKQRDAWADSRYKPLLDSLKRRGITVVADEDISPDPSDATAVALTLQASKADAVIAVLFPKAMTVLMRDMYKIGYKPVVVGGSAVGDLKALDKAIGIPGALDTYSSLFPTANPDDPKVVKWREIIKKYYPDDEFMVWHLFGIASGEFMVAALKAAGPELTRESLIEALNHTSIASEAYAGPISCKPDNHQCYRSMAWFALRDGEVRQIGVTTLD